MKHTLEYVCFDLGQDGCERWEKMLKTYSRGTDTIDDEERLF